MGDRADYMREENANCWMRDTCNQSQCDSFCMKRFKLSHLYDNALIPEDKRRHMPLLLDDDMKDYENFKFLSNISASIYDKVKEGMNLYLFSPICGCGKTSWALRLCQSYLNQAKVWVGSPIDSTPVLFISVPQFLIALKDNISSKNAYAQHIKDTVLNADLVVWDDVATKTTTSFEAENLLSIIDQRIMSGKANIYTSNLSYDELHTAMGDRLASRIYNYSTVIQFKGKDKRGIER